jgi:hypothetical protein
MPLKIAFREIPAKSIIFFSTLFLRVTRSGSKRGVHMKSSIRIACLFIGLGMVYSQASVIAQKIDRTIERPPSRVSPSTGVWSTFFPLAVGNEWIYSIGYDNLRVQVLRETEESNGLKYFEILGYFLPWTGGKNKIRRGPSGEILEYNPNGPDFLWYHFGPPAKPWPLESGSRIPCVSGSILTPSATSKTVVVPAGSFANALPIAFYQSSCADSGISMEYFAGSVGLVQREVESIAGPVAWKLIFARIDGQEYPAASYGVQVSMDCPVYYNNLMPPADNPSPTARVMLAVKNTTEIPMQFYFSDGQQYDFVVRDSLGNEVLRWSDDKFFTQSAGNETLVNGTLRYTAEIKLQSRDAKPLPAGFYTLSGYLTAKGSASQPSGTSGMVPFEIRNAQ